VPPPRRADPIATLLAKVEKRIREALEGDRRTVAILRCVDFAAPYSKAQCQ
jgi:hypothetical protein